MTSMESLQRMTRDLRAASATLTHAEARYLVDTFYQMQENRIRDKARIRTQAEAGEPHAVLQWLYDQDKMLEDQIKGALGKYAAAHPVGAWALDIVGIGPVLAAGLLANIDMSKCPTVGSIWRFANLDGHPRRMKKGEKMSWSRPFQSLCAFKVGECFVKVCNHKSDIYGHVYAERKALEQKKNEARDYADQAAKILAERNIGKTTDAYKAYSVGKLPPAHIHARARRYAVKLFLSHLHEVWHWYEFGEEAPRPYAFSHLGHAHIIAAPNFDSKTFPVRPDPQQRPKRKLEGDSASA